MGAIIPQQAGEMHLGDRPEEAAVSAAYAPDGTGVGGDWRTLLAGAFRSVPALLDYLGLDPSALGPHAAAAAQFPLRVPLPYARRMQKGDPRDPLLLQVLPDAVELTRASGYSDDPLREQDFRAPGGLVHKYAGRVLWVLTGACAIHCRYCFRRHFPYAETRLDPARRRAALDYIAANPSIEEVILSGGDPLALGDDTLAALVGELAAVPHLRRLRVHSRLPVVLPQRITAAMVDWLAGSRLAPVLVVHCNHPREIDPEVCRAVARLRAGGITVFNQAVLLKGVNDDVDTLAALSEALFNAGIIPYYLHTLDPVAGAAGFALPTPTARHLYGDLLARLPGYLVPRLVSEAPGAASKIPLAPATEERCGGGNMNRSTVLPRR